MATSGVTTWTLNKDQVISAALRKLAALRSGATPSTNQIADATVALNAMLKGYQTDGMPLWAIKEYSFPTVANISSYQIGEGQTIDTPMPLKLLQAFRSGTGFTNVPMNIYAKYDYNLLPLNNSEGTPVNIAYQPFSTYGILYLWPVPLDTSNTISIRYQRPFEDMVSASDDFDFPSYWMEPIIYGLAVRLAPEYGLSLEERQLLIKEASMFKEQALSFGTEEASLYFQPDWINRNG